MKTFFISVATSVLMMGLLMASLVFLFDVEEQEVIIQSLESRTSEDKPVFNKIKYIKKANQDIWMMNQSHAGLTNDLTKWERLAIVVEDKKASFYQFQAGPLEWSEDLLKKQVSYRVSCFMCHNNGPRAIRPDQQGLSINFYDQTKIFFWNLKIKSYGRIQESEEMSLADQYRKIPFKHRQGLENETLNVKTCLHCHKEEGFLARGKLTRQQAGTIEFLVKNKIMPPAGFSLSLTEQNQINDFVAGF
jgi:hypothetical protein